MTDPSTWLIARSRQLRIGHTIIDTEALSARRGALAETIEPKVLGVLLVLADQAGKVVSRADLIKQVWGTVASGDESLTRAIFRIRKLLGDERGVQAAIETVPRRGYRLLAEVIWLEESPPGADKQTPDTLEPAPTRTTESRP